MKLLEIIEGDLPPEQKRVKEEIKKQADFYARNNPYYTEYIGEGYYKKDYEKPKKDFIEGADWAMTHWHKVGDKLPPKDEYFGTVVSIRVLVSDGKQIQIGRYDFAENMWIVVNMNDIKYWKLLPVLTEEDLEDI